MKIKFFIILLLLLLLDSLLASNVSILKKLNTKTTYHKKHTNAEPEDYVNHSECEGNIVHLNLVIRHGTRNPTQNNIIEFKALERDLRTHAGAINTESYAWMKNWVNPFKLEEQGLLLDIGEMEHYNFSKRILKRYPSLFNEKYHPDIYPIHTTRVHRTESSASAFGFGLWEDKGKVGASKVQPFVTLSTTKVRDDEHSIDINLRFFDKHNCKNYHIWKSSDDAKIHSESYFTKYQDNIISKVQTKLGIDPNVWKLTRNEVYAMFKVCAFEASLHHDTTHFCSLFDHDDIEVFETYHDLKDYWEKGYGHTINYHISCPLLNDFVKSIHQHTKGGRAKQLPIERVKLRFAHAETIMPFLSLLGLYKDEYPLKWDQDLSNRVWRTSEICPFSANIAFALYDCGGTHKIRVLVNEEPVQLPSCGGATYCPVDIFLQSYSDFLSHSKCRYNDRCQNPLIMPEEDIPEEDSEDERDELKK